MTDKKSKKDDLLKDGSFSRDVAVNVASNLVTAVLIYLLTTQVPLVYNNVRKVILELQTTSQDPELVAWVAEGYLQRGEPAKALAVSSDFVQAGYSYNANAYNRVLNVRQQAQAKLNLPSNGQDTVMVRADDAKRMTKV